VTTIVCIVPVGAAATGADVADVPEGWVAGGEAGAGAAFVLCAWSASGLAVIKLRAQATR
jgi:hypothetical protein